MAMARGSNSHHDRFHPCKDSFVVSLPAAVILEANTTCVFGASYGKRRLGKHCVGVAWAGLLAAWVSPPHGIGVALCWFQGSTGLPCPGCGLWRSLSCGIRGLFLESWRYHPMGLLVLTWFLFTAGQSVLPRSWRDGLRLRMQIRTWNVVYFLFVVTFVGFGAVRVLWHYARH
jgi:hypothetical protein